MDRTTTYLFAMVGIVALTCVLMLLIRFGGSSSISITGNVVASSPSASVQASPATSAVLADNLADSSASAATRTLTILAVSFLLAIAAYLYMTPAA